MKKLVKPVIGTDKDTSFRHRALAKGGLQDAADFLSQVEKVSITLESGKVLEIDLAHELKIPTDPLLLRRDLARAPSQLAFFAYQMERAHAVLRRLERDEEKASGTASLTYRTWYKDHEGVSYTEDMIRSRVGIDTTVCKVRDDLIAARNVYGVLRATRDAIEHRVYAIRKLVGNDGDANRG